jgi:hypothetical protein
MFLLAMIIFLVCAGNTTTEPQGTGRKRAHGDPEGADSGKCKCFLYIDPVYVLTCMFMYVPI